MNVVNATGISSGRTDMASVSALRRLSTKSPDEAKLIPHTMMKTIAPPIAIFLTKLFI